MSHDSNFPESNEIPEQRTDRALAALYYEDKAGLGFRRRERSGIGNPYADPERYQVSNEPSSGDLWAGLLAGLGAVIGFSAIFYKPLLLGLIAVILTVIGSIGNGQASHVARYAFITVIISVTIGMLLSIFVTHAPVF